MTRPSLTPASKIGIGLSDIPGAGRGVFATARISAGELIEQCPVVVLTDKKDRGRLRKTGLVNYYFLWGDTERRAAICLGWGAVYNHSFTPNARFEKVIEDCHMDFIALRAIEPGEEILVNYNGDPANTAPVHIPGIPAAAGGMPAPRLPRIVAGFVRRARLAYAWVAGRPLGVITLAFAGAA